MFVYALLLTPHISDISHLLNDSSLVALLKYFMSATWILLLCPSFNIQDSWAKVKTFLHIFLYTFYLGLFFVSFFHIDFLCIAWYSFIVFSVLTLISIPHVPFSSDTMSKNGNTLTCSNIKPSIWSSSQHYHHLSYRWGLLTISLVLQLLIFILFSSNTCLLYTSGYI